MAKAKKESREERFTRVALRRTNNIIKHLEYLGNCANKSSYAYNDKEISQLFGKITNVVTETRNKFTKPKLIKKLSS